MRDAKYMTGWLALNYIACVTPLPTRYFDQIGHAKHIVCMLEEQDRWDRSLTVKDTMLETKVVKAEGMNVSCFGIGLIRKLTFCKADAKAFKWTI